MHIAITTLWFPHDKNPLYGIFILNQAKDLAEYVDVTVMISRRKPLPYSKRYKIGKVNVIEKGGPFLPNTSEKRLANWSDHYIRMFEIVNKESPVDLIHCHDYIALYPTREIHKKHKTPYIVTIHNTDFLRGRVDNWRSRYIKDAFYHCHRIISVGVTLGEKLREYAQDSKILIIPNGIDTDLFSLSTTKSQNPFKFLFIGIYEERKRVMEILRSFHKLNQSNIHLTFIGYGSLEKQMRKYVSKYNLSSSVDILPPIKNEELTPIYQKHHCYISYSTSETFGITVAEAMSCGLHILYSKSGGPEHFVSPQGALLVEGNDLESLSKKMEEMVSIYNPDVAPSIRDHVIQNLSKQVVVSKLLSLYKSIAKSSSYKNNIDV